MSAFEYKKETIARIAAKLKSFGYTVYVAQDRTYGFYTDGKRVVCFQSDWIGSVSFSCNYRSQRCGSGWQPEGGKELADIDAHTAEIFLTSDAPRWATSGEQVTYTTPEQHLKNYGKYCSYTQI